MPAAKLKIFVSAFSCAPNSGSETGVGWHWVLEMSRHFDLWVLVNELHRKKIVQWLDEHGNENDIKFIFHAIPFRSLFYREGYFRMVRAYYLIWTKLADKIVKKTMLKNDIDVFYHLTFGNAIWPVSSYGQKQFFVWGPVGGAEAVPAEYSRHYSLRGRWREWARRLVIGRVKKSSRFIKRCENARLILCKTETTLSIIPQSCKHKAVLFTDVATEGKGGIDNVVLAQNKTVKYITVGFMEGWRGVDLLISAFSQSVKMNPDIELYIVGDGRERRKLEKLISDHHLGRWVKLTGIMKIKAYKNLLNQCDVMVNSCVKEGGVTVSFDALQQGKPLICLDSGGYTRLLSGDCAAIIPLHDKRCDTIRALSDAILELTDAGLRLKLSHNALKRARQLTWEQKGKDIAALITRNYNL